MMPSFWVMRWWCLSNVWPRPVCRHKKPVCTTSRPIMAWWCLSIRFCTGCAYWKPLAPREGVEAHGKVQAVHQEYTGQKTQRARACPSTLCHGVARLVLSGLRSEAAVACDRGPCEKLLRARALAWLDAFPAHPATRHQCATWAASPAPETTLSCAQRLQVRT